MYPAAIKLYCPLLRGCMGLLAMYRIVLLTVGLGALFHFLVHIHNVQSLQCSQLVYVEFYNASLMFV